jgi:hypothetical protein
LKFNREEQIAGAGEVPPMPAEMFAPGCALETDFPIVAPGQHVEITMRNTSTERRTIKVQLLGRKLDR